jgi:NADH-quinone oxidoreductase subunit G
VDAAVTVHEPKPPDDPDTPLAFSMEGYYGPMPAPVIPYFWAPSWNSVQALNKFQDEVGGPLRGGDPGVRLIEPHPEAAPRYFQDVPDAFVRKGKWLIVPLHEIFGSEELSRLSPAVSERVPPSYLALNREDAASLQVAEGAIVRVDLDATTCRLPVRMRTALPSGVAGVVVGLSGSIGVNLPAWGTVAADGASVEGRQP